MKCPNDQTEMKKGALLDDGQKWFSNILSKLATMGPELGYEFVFAYHCPKCGKIELTTKKENE